MGASRQERIAGGDEGGTRGDHVVDNQHARWPGDRTGDEIGTLQSLIAVAARLRDAMAAIQHAPTRLAPPRCERAGEQFGLVVAACAGTLTAGGRPRDHIDHGRVEPPAELFGEVTSEATAVAVLQADDELFGQAGEFGGGDHTAARDDWRGGHKGEAAAAAQFHARFGASGTTVDEHVLVVPRGCATVPRCVRVPRAPPTSPISPPIIGGATASVLPVVVADSSLNERAFHPRSTLSDWSNRLARCIVGLAMFGVGIALILQSGLGAAPWDMLHKGISQHLHIKVGVVIEGIGFLLLLVWIPLRQRPGVGTILNAFEIGFVLDLVAPHLPDTHRLLPRIGFLVIGVVIVAIGSGLYIGAGLGTGPRDGIMVGLSRRGHSVRAARTLIEFTVGVGGILLGVRPGVGTLIFMFGIGPMVQVVLPKLSLPPRGPDERVSSEIVRNEIGE